MYPVLCDVATARVGGRKLPDRPIAFVRGELVLRRRTGLDGTEQVNTKQFKSTSSARPGRVSR